jgi:hypothetical protein
MEEINYQKLKLEDYKGKPITNTTTTIQTYWKLSYEYSTPKTVNSETKFKMKIINKFDEEKSWVNREAIKKREKEVLAYEQGKFNFSILICLEVLNEHEKKKYSSENYSKELEELVSEMMKKYKTIEGIYEKETECSKNQTEQKVKIKIKKEMG